MTPASRGGPPEAPADTGTIHVVDAPTGRVHRLADFLNLAAALIGIVLVLLLGAYASGTTSGITSDVQGFASVLRRVLVAPVNVLEGLLTLGAPAAVIVALILRREPRRILESLAALAVGIGAALTAATTTRLWGTPELVHSLSITHGSVSEVTMPAYLAGLAAMLTTAGRRRSNRAVQASWTALWIGLSIAVISGLVTIAAVFVTVLIGRSIGLVARYAFGAASDRAYGPLLIDAIRRAGFETKKLIRIDPEAVAIPPDLDAASAAMGRTRQGRIYALTTSEGHHLVVVALDGDQQIAGTLQKFWRTGRLRGLDARADLSLRHSAEGTALVSHAARTAGVRTPRVLGMAQARDTMVLVYQRPTDCRPFADLAPGDVSDGVMAGIWEELLKAHRAGITHRALTSETVLVGSEGSDDGPTVWFTSWEMGEVASGTLSRRVDIVQMIALLAAKVGAKRAVKSAFTALGKAEVSAVAPFLQAIVLPRQTRLEARTRRAILAEVRAEIVKRLPEAPAAAPNLTRFGLRTVITIGLGIVALWLVLYYFNAPQIIAAFNSASTWWAVAVFGWALLAFVGAALTLIAFSPTRLPVGRVLLAQVAAAYVAIAAPAGVGPAAINLRMLTRRDVKQPLAVATVGLVQVSGIVVTVVGLFILSLVTGSGDALAALPSSTVLVALAAAAVAVAIAMSFPRARSWVATKVRPTIQQTWPRLVQVVGQPWRLALGILGNLLVSASYVLAFDAALRAFGQNLPVVDVAVLYLLGNAAGAIVPTPGGLGAVEGVLITALTPSVGPLATSVVLLFRALTYWARIPLGWGAMRFLQAKGEL